ncbi:MAG TPA: Uma2 family endonuclease [Thermoanaerobaculia bacterium]
MAPQATTPMTYEEFIALPEDGKRYELIEGELVLNPAPVTKHQRVLRKLLTRLDRYFEERGGGEVFCTPYDVVLSDETIVEPDLLVVMSERASIVREKRAHGAPNITIEILSEGSRRRDEVTKRRLYEQHGVDEYWIVDPAIDVVKLYRRMGTGFEPAVELNTESGGAITSPLLPGFALDVNFIFAE